MSRWAMAKQVANTLFKGPHRPLGPQLQLAGMPGLQLPGAGSSLGPLERAGELLREGVLLFAVPKKKKSYSRTRMRVNAPNKRVHNISHFYTCRKCDKGLLKLRHHLCPCALEGVKAKNIVKVQYGDGTTPEDDQ